LGKKEIPFEGNFPQTPSKGGFVNKNWSMRANALQICGFYDTIKITNFLQREGYFYV
jgi:hypothetical protein